MEDSLLISLRSYHPRPSRDPLEDFITEAFAWTLRTHPPIGRAFLAEIDRRVGLSGASTQKGELGWYTQQSVNGGIVDMMVRSRSRTYIFEHKVWSEATADQVDTYRQSQENEVVTVLITAARWNYKGSKKPEVEDPDLHLTWADVSKILAEKSEEISDSTRIEDFMALLDHEGLGPRERLSEPNIRAVTLYQDTLDNLVQLIREIRAQKESWAFAYEMLPDPNGQKKPEERWNRKVPKHGRIALRLYSGSYPNINFGLIVDPDNIKTELVEPELGPDLAAFVHIPYHGLSNEQYTEIVTCQAYEDLRRRLKNDGGKRWTVFAPRGTDPDVNQHHPIVLQQPLARVLRGTFSVDEQRAAVLETLQDGVRLFLEGGEIGELREKINRYEEK